MTQSLASITATQIVAGLSSGELLLDDVVAALRSHHRMLNGDINAFEFTAPQNCGVTAGQLHGLPITVKDQIAVAGMPISYGLDRAGRKTPAESAPVVQGFLDAGANVWGKTHYLRTLWIFRLSILVSVKRVIPGIQSTQLAAPPVGVRRQ